MAYMDFNHGGLAMATAGATHAPAITKPTLSALEWSVVALAERDHPSTMREPGRIAVALGALFGGYRHPRRLADPKLEALRRMAILSWRHGYVVPGEAVREFLAAGFSSEQYELLVDSIRVALAKRKPRTVR